MNSCTQEHQTEFHIDVLIHQVLLMNYIGYLFQVLLHQRLEVGFATQVESDW
jgi:hypothetical protein